MAFAHRRKMCHRMDEFYFIKIKMMCHRETKHQQLEHIFILLKLNILDGDEYALPLRILTLPQSLLHGGSNLVVAKAESGQLGRPKTCEYLIRFLLFTQKTLCVIHISLAFWSSSSVSSSLCATAHSAARAFAAWIRERCISWIAGAHGFSPSRITMRAYSKFAVSCA